MNFLFPKGSIAVDENKNVVEMLTVNAEESAHRDTYNESMAHTAQTTPYTIFFFMLHINILLFVRKSGFRLVLSLIIHPVCAFGLFSSTAMIIGILVVCYTVPKPPGLSIYSVLAISHIKNPK
jgi:hypothetical protein